MKLTRATVSIRPWYYREGVDELHIEVTADNRSFVVTHPFTHDSFASEFDQVWAELKLRLDRLIADAQKGEPAK